jgi:hypothetical protein
MRRRLLGLLGLFGLVGVLAVSGGSAATQVAVSWGTAIEVPGTAALNTGGNAQTYSVSCATAGNCTAGGQYLDGSSHYQAFVVSETNGSWGNAIEVPGSATLNSGGGANTSSVSCATAGNCTAGGTYTDGSGNTQAFVVSETNGSWGNAIEVPGSATLNSGGRASTFSVSCATAGNCTAGGYYTDGSAHQQSFVVDETNGSWGNAIEVPGSATLNTGTYAGVNSVSCATAGNCTAGGFYTDGSEQQYAFVVDETNGSWGNAIEVPGSATLNTGTYAAVWSVSCATAGNCTAGGTYTDGSAHQQSFVVDETNGSWGNAIEVPGSATLNTGTYAGVNSVSCATAGNCTAGGFYSDGSEQQYAFVVDETNGSWGNAIEVPGSATLNTGRNANTDSVSCATAGNCTAGGYYTDGSGHQQSFVVDETNGSWGNAIEVPGSATLNTGTYAAVWSVSCTTAGNCTAGGTYTDGSGAYQAFVVAITTKITPKITLFAPLKGPAGTAVTITGSGFDGATAVKFHGVNAASFHVDSDTQITADTAAHTTTGTITVTGPGGTATSAASFTPLAITSFSPTSGIAGKTVTITGSGFTGTTAVEFNGTNAQTFTVNSDTKITAIVASGTTLGTVTVAGPAGTATSAAVFAITPKITLFAPLKGPAGTAVTITGSGFDGATAVKFHGVNAASFHVDSDTQITADTAAHTTTGTITVTGPGGTATSASSYTMLAITSFSPTSGIAGKTVTITGSGFTGTTAVEFNGTNAQTFTVNSDTKITAIIASGTTLGSITVTGPAGTATSAAVFAITPKITSLTPSKGPAGTAVTITGSGFDGATAVKFHGVAAASFHVDSDTQITAHTAANTTSGTVTVTGPGGTATSASSYTMLAITSFSPTSGTAGKTVTITGSGFTGTTAVEFNGTNAQTFTVNSDTKITAVVAIGTTTGTITVTGPSGTATSKSAFTIST